MTPEQFINYLKEQVTIHGSQKAMAAHYGIGQAFLSEVLRGRREPGDKIPAALGFRKVISYEVIDREGK